RVINDLIGADRADHLDILRTAYASHLRAECLRDLHRERAHTARRAVDQDLLPGVNLPLVAKTLQRSECRHRYRRRLLERDVGRFQHDAISSRRHVLRECARSPAEDLVAWLELRHALADRLDGPSEIDAKPCLLRLAQSHAQTA